MKRPWLCRECEDRLNSVETPFANEIFRPLIADSGARVPYGSWMLKFCVSLSWRVLLRVKEEGHDIEHYSDIQKQAIDEALSVWAKVLLEDLPHPGQYEQHFVPITGIADFSGSPPPRNINRYLMRAVAMDLAGGETTLLVLTKLGPFLVIGMLAKRSNEEWQGTKVRVRGGMIQPQTYTLPYALWEYLTEKAEEVAQINRSMSPAQRSKISDAFWKDIERTRQSGWVKAMGLDVDLFGDDAFDPPVSD